MAANRTSFSAEPPRAEMDRRLEPLKAQGGDRARPLDPAHEHGPPDDRGAAMRQRVRDEHCPSEVYVG